MRLSYLLLSGLILAGKSAGAQSSRVKTEKPPSPVFHVAETYLSKHDIIFQSPTELEAEGFPMGNGDLGGMIWNHDNGIEIQINKNDLWSAPVKAENDRSILKHAARLKIDFGAPVFSWIHLENFTGRLSLSNAEVSYQGRTGFSDVRINTWLAHGKNVWVIACEHLPRSPAAKQPVATISLERLGSRAFMGWYSGGFPNDVSVGQGQPEVTLDGNTMLLHETADGLDVAVACRILDGSGEGEIISDRRGDFRIRQPRFQILVSVVTGKESHEPTKAALDLLNDATQETIQKLHQEKDAWYKDFWSKSFVKLGNDYLENIYYLRRYLMAAGSQGKYPVAFNGGLWRWNRDVLNWATPHHWNTQQQYFGLGAQNDCDLMRPYLNTYFNMIPAASELAKEKGASDSAILITEAHEFDGRQVSKNWDAMAHDFTPASQIALQFWEYYRFTGDEKFLREKAYVFMQKAAHFYLDKLQWDEKKQAYFLLSSLYESETIREVKNALSDRECIEALFRACISAAEQLKVDKDAVKRWKDVLQHLWPRTYQNDPKCGELLAPAYEYFTADRYSPFIWSVGGLAAFPAGLIGIDDVQTRTGQAVVHLVQCQESANAHYPAPVIAARMGLGDVAMRYLTNGVATHQMYPQGLMHNVTGYPDNIYNLQSVHDLIGGYKIRSRPFFQMGMEAMSEYATTVNEMLLQSNEGKIRIFPAIPAAWKDSSEVAFTLLARGAFLVSSLMRTGAIAAVNIRSQLGNRCTLMNPWPGRSIQVMANGKKVKWTEHEHNVIDFATKANTEYVISLAGKPEPSETVEFEGSPNQVPKKWGTRILGKLSGWNKDYK